jgi:NADH:ubiquinone oxidoreductase subunit 6 (subunit J)
MAHRTRCSFNGTGGTHCLADGGYRIRSFGCLGVDRFSEAELVARFWQIFEGAATLVTFMIRTRWFGGEQHPASPTTAAIGELLMKDYILPFEVASILLLMALIGAAMIVRRRSQ